MEILYVKGIALGVILILSLVFSLLPLKFISVVRHTLDPVRRQRYKRGLGFLSCYGGGVFLGACLLDLYPEVQSNLSDVFNRIGLVTPFPLIEFVVTIGFFIVFIVEQIVLAYKENQVADYRERRSLLQHQDSVPSYSTAEPGDQHAGVINSYEESGHSHDHSIAISVHEDPNSHSNLRAVVLLLAISLHSVFEGLAVGLQANVDQLVQLLIAVAIHKTIIALSLGMNLVQSRLKLKIIILCDFIFSLAAPVGLGIGMGVTDTEQSIATELASGLLEGLACGTFLYVTFFEVLPHEMNNAKDRLLKVIFIILGYATICAAMFLDQKDERPSCFEVPSH